MVVSGGDGQHSGNRSEVARAGSTLTAATASVVVTGDGGDINRSGNHSEVVTASIVTMVSSGVVAMASVVAVATTSVVTMATASGGDGK